MGKNSLNNFICHLSWLKKLSPAHTHPLKTIREFSKPYELLFSELESLVKCNHKIRVQECYGGRAMSCPWHGGVEAYGGAPFGRHAALRLFHFKKSSISYWILTYYNFHPISTSYPSFFPFLFFHSLNKAYQIGIAHVLVN